MQFAIDLSSDDAEAKARAMTDLFKQALQKSKGHTKVVGSSVDVSSNDSAERKHSSDTAQTYCPPSVQMRPATGLFMEQGGKHSSGTAQMLCPPSVQMHCPPSGSAQMLPATGLFMKQGVQAVCCTFHAQAQAQPKRSEEFARWTLTCVTPLSRHSASYHFTSTDGTRGTPYTRGRGRTIWHRTWHTTMRTTHGIERDYTPTSTWEQWDSGTCDLLVHVHASDGAASWLHTQPLGSEVWLSKPKTTLSVPSLVQPNHHVLHPNLNQPDALAHAGILLVLGGAAGLPTALQVLQHAAATTCFGTGAARAPPIDSPVHLIYACERDDVLMTSQLAQLCAAQLCAAEGATSARLRRLVLTISHRNPTISAPHDDDDVAAFPHDEVEDAQFGLGQFDTLDNVRILQGESPLTGELLQAEMAPLHALGRCRVVVSGPAAFNVAVAEMLEAQCQIAPDAITIVQL